MIARALALPRRCWARWDRGARLTLAGMVGVVAIALAAPGPPATTPAATSASDCGSHHECGAPDAAKATEASDEGSSGIIGY